MAASRKARSTSRPKTRRAGTPVPRGRRAATRAAVASSGQPAPEQAPPEPPVLLLGHPGGPEVIVVEPAATAPAPRPRAQRPRSAIRLLPWTASAALMVGAIIAGLHLGYSIKGWMAQTGARDAMRQAAEARPPESGSAESAPPRRGDEWSPGTSSARVDQSPRTPHRAPAPKGSPPAPVEAPDARPWVRLTALMGEGIRLHRAGWYGPAMARFREAVAIMPDYLRAYLWLGRSGLKAGRYEEARRALERVIALGPHSAAAQEARALLSQLEKDN